jgi:hypothetical protein
MYVLLDKIDPYQGIGGFEKQETHVSNLLGVRGHCWTCSDDQVEDFPVHRQLGCRIRCYTLTPQTYISYCVFSRNPPLQPYQLRRRRLESPRVFENPNDEVRFLGRWYCVQR